MPYLLNQLGFDEKEKAYEENRAALLQRAKFADPAPDCPIPGAVEACSIVGHDAVPVTAGTFCEPSVDALREAVTARVPPGSLPLTVCHVAGDIRDLQLKMLGGGVVQAASQLNYLEFSDPSKTPEDGVAPYEHDRTQGPACATFAAAGTLYRNYLVKRSSAKGETGEVRRGQTAADQLNSLRDLTSYLDTRYGEAMPTPWNVRNGYIFGNADGLTALNAALEADADLAGELIRRLRVGVQLDTQSTAEGAGTEYCKDPTTGKWDSRRAAGCPDVLTTTQVYCSAIGLDYDRGTPSDLWTPFAKLVLEAAYEATFLIGLLERASAEARGINLASRRGVDVYATLLGNGVFGNPISWVRDAILVAAERVDRHAGGQSATASRGTPLRVHVVHYQAVDYTMRATDSGYPALPKQDEAKL